MLHSGKVLSGEHKLYRNAKSFEKFLEESKMKKDFFKVF